MAFPRGINPGVLNFVCVSEVAPSTFKASANSLFFIFLTSNHLHYFFFFLSLYGQFLFYSPDIKPPLTLLFFFISRDDLLVLVVVVVLV